MFLAVIFLSQNGKAERRRGKMTGYEKSIHVFFPGIPGEGITLKELMDHLAGPVISLAIHLLALGILGSMVLAKAPEKAPEELLVEIRDVIAEAVPVIREERREMPEETLEESPVFELSRPLPESAAAAPEVTDPIQLSGTLEDIAIPTPAVPHTKSALRLSVTSTFGSTGGGNGSGKGASGRKKNSYEGMLQGVFYDLKQTRGRKDSGANLMQVMHEFVNGEWRKKYDKRGVLSYPELEKYYSPRTRLWNSCFYIPRMEAAKAPEAFHCGKEVAPSRWVAIYSGLVRAPFSGKFRFVGSADDVLVVRFNEKVVLDYGYFSFSMGSGLDAGKKKAMAQDPDADPGIRREVGKYSAYRDPVEIFTQFGGSSVGHATGRTIEVREGALYPIDILISEIPGGIFHAALFIQRLDENGIPLENNPRALPLFRTTLALPGEDLTREEGSNAARFLRYGPVWRAISGNEKTASSSAPVQAGENDDFNDLTL